MAIDSVAGLVSLLRQRQLLDPSQLDEVIRVLQPRCGMPRVLAKELVRRGWLTVYQVNQIFDADGRDLVLGHYRLLDVLGKGAVSQVYKAWDTRKKIFVALKVIHPELLTNTEALAQFQMEMRAVSQLCHPNIVQALEPATTLGNKQFFAMEYVEGNDLGKLVQLSGPLPVLKACDYIRQAALGLQHAYERGLVHRDIKPANLLVTNENTQIKILDMGLARLEWLRDEERMASTIHRVQGGVMGSPDYMAPEQAVDPDSADIRADIYSLGCTFYTLLTGQVPYPVGSLAQKLLKHQTADPPAAEEHRSDLPPTLPPVLRRMMAKRPADRYQMPASVVAALAPLVRRDSGSSTNLRGLSSSSVTKNPA
ncbi:MAG: serine/threonine-protein kinase [Gemmataceae bacterium]